MAMQRIARKPAQGKCRGIGSADDYRSSIAQAANNRAIGFGYQVFLNF